MVGWVAALALLIAVALVWVVDPGQRLVMVGWSALGVVLLSLVIRIFPDSPERPVRPPVEHPLREAFRLWPFYVTPSLLGQVGRHLVPGEPSMAVETGVFLGAMSTGVGATVLIGTRWSRRRTGAR